MNKILVSSCLLATLFSANVQADNAPIGICTLKINVAANKENPAFNYDIVSEDKRTVLKSLDLGDNIVEIPGIVDGKCKFVFRTNMGPRGSNSGVSLANLSAHQYDEAIVNSKGGLSMSKLHQGE